MKPWVEPEKDERIPSLADEHGRNYETLDSISNQMRQRPL
jgi:hypothetical protein